MNKYYLFIDDERNINIDNLYLFNYITIVRSYEEAVKVINFANSLEDTEFFIDLDHDLGEGKTGYDICKYLVENNIPCHFRIHSMNPVGRINMCQLLTRYGNKRFYLEGDI